MDRRYVRYRTLCISEGKRVELLGGRRCGVRRFLLGLGGFFQPGRFHADQRAGSALSRSGLLNHSENLDFAGPAVPRNSKFQRCPGATRVFAPSKIQVAGIRGENSLMCSCHGEGCRGPSTPHGLHFVKSMLRSG